MAISELLTQRLELSVLHQIIELTINNVLRALLAQPLEQLLLLLLAQLPRCLLSLTLVLFETQ